MGTYGVLETLKTKLRGVCMLTEEQKKEIEYRINQIARHSYNSVLSAEWKGIKFALKVMGYYPIYEWGEYKIVKLD